GHSGLEHVTQVAAPPGSIFKPVVAAADLADPVPPLPPGTVVPTGARFSYSGHSFANWRPLGPANLVSALAWSNDVYFYKLALALGPERIHDLGTALGAGQDGDSRGPGQPQRGHRLLDDRRRPGRGPRRRVRIVRAGRRPRRDDVRAGGEAGPAVLRRPPPRRPRHSRGHRGAPALIGQLTA